MKSEEEIALTHSAFYKALYDEFNPNNLLEVDANSAAQFLKKSGVNVLFLSQIWELADYRKKGSLDKLGAYIAFKLIAAVQQGFPVDISAIDNISLNAPIFPGVLLNSSKLTSTMSSISTKDLSQTFRQQRSASVASRTSLVGDWEIDPGEQSKYETVFYSLNPVNGKLNGEQCRPVFLNSNLPQIHLAKIWELSDIDRDGFLDKYEMCIALHLVYKCLQNEPLPDFLPISMIHPMKRVQCGISSKSINDSAVYLPSQPRRLSSNIISPQTKLSLKSRTSSISSTSKNKTEDSFNSIFDPKFVNSESWPVDVSLYETVFQEIDTDQDGLVNGTDARSYLMSSGLLQVVLAQIWTLVDTAKLGRLNLEQFALVNQLIKEFQHDINLPDQLPLNLIPPSIRSRTAVSRVSSSGNSLSNVSLGGNSTSTNPLINELNEKIEKAMETRRKAEQDLFQLEADTLVKNSEIKNLEIEVQTMNSTVKQLQHQKSEANKRLLDLDNRIIKLEGICNEHAQRLSSETERLNKVKQEIAQANDNLTAEEEQLGILREEARLADEKYAKVKGALVQENSKIESLVNQLTRMERQTDANNSEIERIEKLTTDLNKFLEQIETQKESNNSSDFLTDEEIVSKQFDRINLNSECNNFLKLLPGPLSFSSDLFKDDPFENSDEIKNSFGVDPFGVGLNGGITTSNNGISQTDDPFGSNNSQTSSMGGGNFADFSKFANF